MVFHFSIFDFFFQNFEFIPFSSSSSVYQQVVFPFWVLCQHQHVSLKTPCDLVKEGDWPWPFPTRYNSCRFYRIVHWATKSSDWGYSTNSEWQDVTETPFTTNEDFHYPQEMQKNHAFQDHRVSRSQYNLTLAWAPGHLGTLLSLVSTHRNRGHFSITSGVAQLGPFELGSVVLRRLE
jgi:hypothetical protein